MGSGDVLVLGLGPDAKPSGAKREGSGRTIHCIEAFAGLHLALPGSLAAKSKKIPEVLFPRGGSEAKMKCLTTAVPPDYVR